MKKFMVVFIAASVLLAGGMKEGKKPKKECFNICQKAKNEAVSLCIETKQNPLSECIQRAQDEKKECLKGCKN